MNKLIPVVAGIMVAGVVAGVVVGVGRLPVVSQETERSSGELRWLNVIVELPPQDSPLRIIRDIPHGPEKPRFLIQIYVQRELTPGVEPAPQVLEIDAETGEVVSDTLSAALSSQAVSDQLQAIVASAHIATGPPEVWPYVDEGPPPPEPGKWGSLVFIVPDLASGISVYRASATCLASYPDCVSQYLGLSNGRTHMAINAETGEVMTLDSASAEDRQAFERYAASVLVELAAEGGLP